jgi:hypothetical protein
MKTNNRTTTVHFNDAFIKEFTNDKTARAYLRRYCLNVKLFYRGEMSETESHWYPRVMSTIEAQNYNSILELMQATTKKSAPTKSTKLPRETATQIADAWLKLKKVDSKALAARYRKATNLSIELTSSMSREDFIMGLLVEKFGVSALNKYTSGDVMPA